MPAIPAKGPHADAPSRRDQLLAAVTALLQMLDEQWDDLGEHERRSAVRLSLDTLRR